MIAVIVILIALVVLVATDQGGGDESPPDEAETQPDSDRRQVSPFTIRRVLTSTAVHLLGATALLTGCSRAHAPAAAEAKAALTVELVAPALANWPERIEANGSIAAWQESVVGAEVGDLRLMDVLVNVGDVVTKGQVLARFHAEGPAADLALAEAGVAQAEAVAARAGDKAARARRLGNSGGLSQDDLLQYEAEEKAGAAQLASARAQLQLQRLRLLYTEVRAPDDGVISVRSATVGAVTGPGTELFRLIRRGRLEWRAQVPADQLARVTRDLLATLRVAGQPDLTGFVRQVSPVVDAGTLNGLVYVDLPDPGPLRAGMFVTGELLLPATPALSVPEQALVFRDGYHYLMKVDDANRVRQAKVLTGRRSGRMVEILGPHLTVADRIVRSGGSFLNDGDTVRVVANETAVGGEGESDAEGVDRP
ncbi:Nickel and cobalt resistance protein CnrB [Lacunisphaera limnophila]|uniref:Nickel and cobalt resistance protein CnrB n=1 Tax=Lacunisphaera limnophila TaxID=1838286 RepID=A0A1D8AS41_9BACT|nr:efflux RND transporter periplasmic adaptor subunit [Lacunisphaera limnophila]AOS43715.1 Nickel and cobalt resistance protein CnrB [Lacunisphaera limnophila]